MMSARYLSKAHATLPRSPQMRHFSAPLSVLTSHSTPEVALGRFLIRTTVLRCDPRHQIDGQGAGQWLVVLVKLGMKK
jgi:hypothetical protein